MFLTLQLIFGAFQFFAIFLFFGSFFTILYCKTFFIFLTNKKIVFKSLKHSIKIKHDNHSYNFYKKA